MFISAATGEGVQPLLEQGIRRAGGGESRGGGAGEATAGLELQSRGPRFVITKVDGMLRGRGRADNRLVERLTGDTRETQAEIRRRLARMGVGAALRRAGVRPGDRIRVAGLEMEWLG